GGLGAEVIAGETADALLDGIEDISAIQGFLELGGLRSGDDDIGSDAAAVGLANFRGVIGDLALVVIGVERDGFVIALDEAAAGSVVARGGESEAGVFSEALHGLHEALAESGFANHEAAVVILNGASDDFRGGGGIVVDEDDEGHVQTLIAANGTEGALRGV